MIRQHRGMQLDNTRTVSRSRRVAQTSALAQAKPANTHTNAWHTSTHTLQPRTTHTHVPFLGRKDDRGTGVLIGAVVPLPGRVRHLHLPREAPRQRQRHVLAERSEERIVARLVRRGQREVQEEERQEGALEVAGHWDSMRACWP